MIYKLAWKYDVGTDDLLDIIYSVDFSSQEDLANILGCSIVTIKRRIKKLKDSRLLWITRDVEKNIYYMLGTDAEKRWTWRECKDILEYRNNGEDLGYDVGYQESTVTSNNHNELEVKQSKYLDTLVDKVIESIKTT